MALRVVCLLLFAAVHDVCMALPHPSNRLQECKKNSSILTLEVLPGGGWDNLRNRDMGRVMNFSYSQCQTTEDGLYLIPDEVFVISQKTTVIDRTSEIFEHWLNYSSSTSHSINADVSFCEVLNAKFSSDSQSSKIHQVHERSVFSRSQVRNHIYTANANTDFSLDSRFIHQVKAIADALLNNNTRQATFLAEMMVVDYGTHVITSVDSGANIEQHDYVTVAYYNNSGRLVTSSSTGLNLFKVIKFDMEEKERHEDTESKNYLNNLVHSQTVIHGGQSFYPGMTLKTWQESTPNNLVAIDRSGLPLHYVLNSATLPDLPATTIQRVVESVHQAIELYYEVNKRPGCVDPLSQNFNFQANIDDGSCLGPATSPHIGGIYQICIGDKKICNKQEQKNPDTGAFSCRPPYSSILLQSVEIKEHYMTTESNKDCTFLGFYCDTHYYEVDHVLTARVETYWCASNTTTTPNTGYLFGGLYGQYAENPVTKSKACPLYFFPLKFLSSDFSVCLSNDFERAAPYKVPFGGFASCKAHNPLAFSNYNCPPGFSQHLATIDDGCLILYCVKSGAFTEGQLKPIHLPPFTKPTLISKARNNSLVMVTEGNQPDLPATTIQRVVESVRQAIELYYEVNKRPGCVDPLSQNFNFQANIDDGSCLGPATSQRFGGIYQICIGDKKICNKQEQKNPDTGAFSCRPPYSSILLQSVEIKEHYTTTKSDEDCAFLDFFCDTYYYEVDYVLTATVETYWCASNKTTPPNTGYLFGGLYGQYAENPVTKSKACPFYFFPLKFLSSDFSVCLSNDFERAAPYKVPFGGFASCKAHNPLAFSNYNCPPEFSQHLATIDDGCQILYCVKSGAFTEGQLKPIHLPPFTKPTLISKARNNSLVMVTEGNQVWVRKGNTNAWQRISKDDIGAYLRQHNPASRWGTAIAGLIIAVVIIACLVGGVFIGKTTRRWCHNRREGYVAISDNQPE